MVVGGTAGQDEREGGMGAVFEAEHIDTERRVAVKVLHAQRRNSGWMVQGFRNEARASARIGSPNIVDVYDFKELEDGRLLIAMELLDGPTLHDEVERGLLAWPRIVAIARQICKGLAAAHQAGIVHRDIKPENIILIRRDRRGDFVKLLDFGVAHFMYEGGIIRVTGTAQYMAPEAAEGTADPRADVYSVGCLLYAFATGEPPFEGDTPLDTLLKQRIEDPVPPSKRAHREVPAGFDALVLRCLDKDPDQRCQTMEELEAALCELQLEHGWVTGWDDLPAPAVEEQRRARIEAGLRSLSERGRQRAPWFFVFVAGVVMTIVIAWLAWPRQDASLVRDELEQHVQAAQQAAARFYFVYPPLRDPSGSTAYREVLALEALGDDMAVSRGAELRQEFAATLVRLGDRYWEFEGARPFAYEYYASALIFVDDLHARARAGLAPVALEQLRARATAGEFTEHELLALEPLVALAEPDAKTRVAKLEALRGQEAIPASIGATLDRVLEHPEHRWMQVPHAVDPRENGSTPSEASPGEQDPAVAVVEPTAVVDAPQAPPAADLPRSRQRDPAAARKLVAQARAASRAKDRKHAESLYNRALEADPRSVDALDGLASLAFQQARYGESARYLERAVELGPRNAQRWLALGDAYFKTLRYSDARDAYQRAVELGSREGAGRLQKLEGKLGGATDGG
jgi:tetratricopeptide (TPR) repeat protein